MANDCNDRSFNIQELRRYAQPVPDVLHSPSQQIPRAQARANGLRVRALPGSRHRRASCDDNHLLAPPKSLPYGLSQRLRRLSVVVFIGRFIERSTAIVDRAPAVADG